MARRARIVVPGLPHHITHRGNRRDAIFLRVEDHKAYLRILRKFAVASLLEIWSYALMPNHVHIIAVPEREESLSEALGAAHGTYAEMFNGVYGKAGHLWEGRFSSYVMDEQHLWNAVRYVERNPVRAGLVGIAEEYRWSSAAAHCGLRNDPLLSSRFPPEEKMKTWSDWLSGIESPKVLHQIRQQTQTGHPCGNKDFLEDLGHRLGRPVVIRPRGRPRQEKGVNGDCPHLPLFHAGEETEEP
jgi:putative transposase